MTRTTLIAMTVLVAVSACAETHSPMAPDERETRIQATVGSTAGAATVYGPRRFVRAAGTPETETRSIDARGYDGPFTLRVINGALDGTARVAAAWIEVDGREEVGPSDFSGDVAELSKEVSLHDASLLSVRLASEPGAYITVEITGFRATSAVVGSAGGTAAFQGGDVVIDVPAGAVPDGTELTVNAVTTAPPAGSAPLGGTHFEFGPDGATFDEPLAITIAYDPALVPANVNVDDLRLFVFDEESGAWQALDGSVDATAHTVTGLFHHFSQGGILTLAHVCASGGGYADFETAIGALLPGGTIRVCSDAPHTQRVSVDRPLTIEPEQGAAPTIHTPATEGFLVDAVPAGAVIFRGVSFTSAAGPSVVARTQYDRVVFDDVDVEPTNAGIGALASSVSSSSILVNDSRFTGGRWGIRTIDGGNVHVSGSSFIGQTTASIELDGAVGSVRNSTFTIDESVPGAPLSAVRVVFGSTAVVEDNTFDGCGADQCVYAAGGSATPVAVDVLNNHFSSARQSTMIGSRRTFPTAIRFEGVGASGRIESNVIDGCPQNECIHVGLGAHADVIGNSITTHRSNETLFGIHVTLVSPSGGVPSRTTRATIRNNVIRGSSQDWKSNPLNPDLYHFRVAAISVGFGGSQIPALEGNDIENAVIGIRLQDQSETLQPALDNRVRGTDTAIEIANAASFTMHSSDIEEYVTAIRLSDAGAVDLTCNWWGSTAGPQNVAADVDADRYTPWSNESMTNGGTSACIGGASLSFLRVAPDEIGQAFVVGTLAEALVLVSDDGEIEVAAGSHSVPQLGVRPGITIRGDDAAMPVLDGGGAPYVFWLGNDVNLRRLHLTNASTLVIGASFTAEDVHFLGGQRAISIRMPASASDQMVLKRIETDAPISVSRVSVSIENSRIHSVSAADSDAADFTMIDNDVYCGSDDEQAACVGLAGKFGTVTIRQNEFRAELDPSDAPRSRAVSLPGDVTMIGMVDNTIIGTGGSFEYAFDGAGIFLQSGIDVKRSNILIQGNTIAGARRAVQAFNNAIITSNVISNTETAFWLGYGHDMTITQNDVQGGAWSIFAEGGSLSSLNLTCNWWGHELGPQGGVNGSGMTRLSWSPENLRAVTPWAIAPVARGSASDVCVGRAFEREESRTPWHFSDVMYYNGAFYATTRHQPESGTGSIRRWQSDGIGWVAERIEDYAFGNADTVTLAGFRAIAGRGNMAIAVALHQGFILTDRVSPTGEWTQARNECGSATMHMTPRPDCVFPAFNDVGVAPTGETIAVGENGLIAQLQFGCPDCSDSGAGLDEFWSIQFTEPSTQSGFLAIALRFPSHSWTMGQEAIAYQGHPASPFGYSEWAARTTPIDPTEDITAAWVDEKNRVWATTTKGRILIGDSEWSVLPTPQSWNHGPPAALYDIWGRNSSDVYVAGAFGALFHFDGSSWRVVHLAEQFSGTFRGVAGATAGSRIVVVGDNGTIFGSSR